MTRHCFRCERPYQHVDRGQKFCSKRCKSAFKNLKRKNNAGEVSFIDRMHIYGTERDCSLCQTPVFFHPMFAETPLGPSIDHVLPVTYGGNSKRENLALTHVACNHFKGDGMIEYTVEDYLKNLHSRLNM